MIIAVIISHHSSFIRRKGVLYENMNISIYRRVSHCYTIHLNNYTIHLNDYTTANANHYCYTKGSTISSTGDNHHHPDQVLPQRYLPLSSHRQGDNTTIQHPRMPTAPPAFYIPPKPPNTTTSETRAPNISSCNQKPKNEPTINYLPS